MVEISEEDYQLLLKYKKIIDRPKPVCIHCNELTTDQYMVYESVWKAAGLSYKEYVHLKCLEEILNRPLYINDFPPLSINSGILWALKPRPSIKTTEGFYSFGGILGTKRDL